MQAHNLCYTTLVRESDVSRLDPESYQRSPAGNLCGMFVAGDCRGRLASTTFIDFVRLRAFSVIVGNTFVKASVRRGILPTILDELLAARKRAKADMKASLQISYHGDVNNFWKKNNNVDHSPPIDLCSARSLTG